MAIHNPARVRVFISITLDRILPFQELHFGLDESMVVRKSTARGSLAVRTIAMDSTLVDTRDSDLYLLWSQ